MLQSGPKIPLTASTRAASHRASPPNSPAVNLDSFCQCELQADGVAPLQTGRYNVYVLKHTSRNQTSSCERSVLLLENDWYAPFVAGR
jgi:hypothetical protein